MKNVSPWRRRIGGALEPLRQEMDDLFTRFFEVAMRLRLSGQLQSYGNKSAGGPLGFDLDAGTVKVCRAVEQTAAGLRIKEPKTERGWRTLSLAPSAMAVMRTHRKQLLEQRLVFAFGPSWQVEKYDEHPAHANGIGALQGNIVCKDCSGTLACRQCGTAPARGTKAVDIVGCSRGQVYFIEINALPSLEPNRPLKETPLAEAAVAAEAAEVAARQARGLQFRTAKPHGSLHYLRNVCNHMNEA